MKARLGALLIVLLLGLLLAVPASASSLTTEDVAGELVCQCGCNAVLANCEHEVCGVRDAMTVDISQQIAQGKAKGEIVQSFVDLYGQQVLSAPPRHGFDLVAWVLPFVGIALGGGVIYLMLRVWLRGGRGPEKGMTEEDEEYRRRLDSELEDFKGGFD